MVAKKKSNLKKAKETFSFNKWTLFIASLTLLAALATLFLMIYYKNKEEKLEKGNFEIINVVARYNYDLSGRNPEKGQCPQCPSIEVEIQNQSKLDLIFDYLRFVVEKNGKLVTRDGISFGGKFILPRFSTDFRWAMDCERMEMIFNPYLTKIVLKNQFNVERIITGENLRKLIIEYKIKYLQFQKDLKKYYSLFPIENKID